MPEGHDRDLKPRLILSVALKLKDRAETLGAMRRCGHEREAGDERRLKWLQSKDGLEIESLGRRRGFAQAVNEVLQPGDQEYRLPVAAKSGRELN